MSLVGPRPFVVAEAMEIEGWARKRFEARPGMTGLWQVSGRNELSHLELCRLDYLYVASWSFWWDMQILWQTPAPSSGARRLLTPGRPGSAGQAVTSPVGPPRPPPPIRPTNRATREPPGVAREGLVRPVVRAPAGRRLRAMSSGSARRRTPRCVPSTIVSRNPPHRRAAVGLPKAAASTGVSPKSS